MRSKTLGSIFKKRNTAFLFLLTSLFACSKSSDNNNNTSTTITAFSFQQSSNSIPVSSTAAISGTTINIFLPPNTNPNALVASFTLSDSSIVRVGGIAQQTGVTPNDFSSPVTFDVTQKNGGTISYTVSLTTGISAIDQAATAFLQTYNIPGMSLAITLNGKLVYAQAYGKADVENNIGASPNNLFRVSSLSKQITSAAIMKLMDQGKINMTDKVFGAGAILGTDFGTQPYGNGIANITIDDLLHHTSGGWPDDNTDPLGKNPSMGVNQIISWGIDNVPLLDTVPGRSYYYSHFGYSILGRVIEKITGMPYTQAVQTLILQPSNITDMAIAGNTVADKLPNEVKYYDNTGDGNDPYAFDINRSDAPNGWIASATDMAKFLIKVDGVTPDNILTANALSVMTSGSAANANYACGWEINEYNWWHNGNLPGTATTQARTTQNGNFNYVILTNGSGSGNYENDLGNIFWNALPEIPSWPSYDLF